MKRSERLKETAGNHAFNAALCAMISSCCMIFGFNAYLSKSGCWLAAMAFGAAAFGLMAANHIYQMHRHYRLADSEAWHERNPYIIDPN